MPIAASVLKSARVVHLYFGVWIAPALLFFALSGALQTFDLHSTARDGTYRPAKWILVLAQLHKHQTSQLPPPRRPVTDTASAGLSRGPAPVSPGSPAPFSPKPESDATVAGVQRAAAPPRVQPQKLSAAVAAQSLPAKPRAERHPLPLRIFFLLVSVGLFSSVGTGLYMSYRYSRTRTLMTATLLLGIIVPMALIFI